VVVIAIQGVSYEPVAPFIENKWSGYNMLFAQDTIENDVPHTFKQLGGRDTWPITLIVDEEGVISFTRQGSVTYDVLESEVLKLLAE